MSSPSTIHGITTPAGGDDNDSVAAIAAVIASLESGSIVRRLSQAQIDALTGPQKPAGLVVYNTTTNRPQVSNGSTFSDIPTTPTWQTWTPTLTQGGTVSWNAGTSRAKYYQLGKIVHAYCELAVTGSGTAGQAVSLSLPVTAAAAGAGGGTFFHADTGNLFYTGFAYLASATLAQFVVNGSNVQYGITGGTLSSDSFSAFITYEAP